jgi:penicillin-binding protein 1C
MRRFLPGRGFLALASVSVIAFFTWVMAVPFPTELLAPTPHSSTLILDRHGRLLRETLSVESTRGRWVPLAEVSPSLLLSTVHAEDVRFESHPGIDFLAISRSLWINLTAGETRTGASTITQQTVKLILHRDISRNFATKLSEILWAWRLELTASKNEILENYINRIPYGNQLVGIEAASRMYFGIPADSLSLAQSAFLAVLPSSPSRLDPYRFFDRTKNRQRWLLDLMFEREAIDETTYRRALAEPISLLPRRGTLHAPHFSLKLEQELKMLPPDSRPNTLVTTLDLDLQQRIESALLTQAEDGQHGEMQVAAIVLDTPTSEVLAYVGSRNFHDTIGLGQNDGVSAPRQPGSTLKPLLYAAYFDQNPEYAKILDDSPREFPTATGPYRPENYDRRFRGPVTIREALGSSLNIPAVSTLAEIGLPNFLTFLRQLGFSSLTKPSLHYGLGLALGNGEVRLLEIAGAYATLGRLGLHRPVITQRIPTPSPPIRVISEESAFVILDMLSDDFARGIGFGLAGPFDLPYRLAAKTGTSSDYRDNLAVAVTPLHTVAVWVGRFDGRPMPQHLGRRGAAPLLRQIVQQLYPTAAHAGDVPWFPTPATLAKRCPTSTPCAHPEWARK